MTEHFYDDDNPLLDLLIEKQHVPAVCVTPCLAYVLGMTSLLTGVNAIVRWEFRFDNTLPTSIWGYAVQITWPPLFVMPLAAWLLARWLTASLKRQDVYELVVISRLDGQAIVRALSAASYFWLRGWLMWLFGYTPLLIGSIAYLNTRAGMGWVAAVPKGAVWAAILWLGMVLGIKSGIATGLQPSRGVLAVMSHTAQVVQWVALVLLTLIALLSPLEFVTAAVPEIAIISAVVILFGVSIGGWHWVAVRWATIARS